MNTDKEILLNKDKIKSLENKIKENEIFINTEEHNFARILYEHNLLIKESVDFCEHVAASKENFLKKYIDILNNPKIDDVQILRKNIVCVRNIFEIQDNNPSIENSSDFEKFLSDRSIWITKNKTKLRFDNNYLTKEEGYKISMFCNLELKQIIDFAELHDFCEFDKKYHLNSEKNSFYKSDCLIEGANGHTIVIELDKNYKTYQKYVFVEKDKKKKKEYLIKYLEGLKEQIEKLSSLEFVKGKNNYTLHTGNTILYIPSEHALKSVLEIDPGLIKYAYEKNIQLSFPTTFLAVAYYISLSHAPKGISQEFKNFEKIHKNVLENKRKEIESNKEKIDKLLKINFEYLKAPSYQIKVTLNHEENYVLEDIVNAKGSNKSSVLRQILMEYNGIYKERDALKLAVEKFTLEKKFLENKRIYDLNKLLKEQELIKEKHMSELERKLLEIDNQRELMVRDEKKKTEVLENELMRRTEQFQAESSNLKDEIRRKDNLLDKAIESLNESLANKDQSLKDGEKKNIIQVIKPKKINEFGNIMELINQNILILCDTSSIANKDQQRFIDMVYGGVYGLKGKIKEVSTNIFLYIPQNFDFLDI